MALSVTSTFNSNILSWWKLQFLLYLARYRYSKMIGNPSGPNTSRDQLRRIPVLIIDDCCDEMRNCATVGISPDNQIQYLGVRPIISELYLMGLTVFAATAKLIFSIIFVFILMYPDVLHPIISRKFDGIHYVAHASLYLIISVSGAINTFLMVHSRFASKVLDRPEFLRYYIILTAFGICLQVGIYLMFSNDSTNDPTSRSIGDVMGLLMLLDVAQCGFFVLYEYSIRLKVNQLYFELGERFVCNV